MVAILAPQLPLAYLAACFAVARARRGDVPDWRGVFGSASAGSRDVLSPPARTGFPRPPAPRRGSSGGSRAGRCRRWVGHPAAVRAGPALRRPPRAARPRRDHARRRAAHPALHGRLRGRDGRPAESGCERFLRPDAVRGDAAAHERRARRRQAAGGDLEHARRVAAGPRRHPARAHPVGHLAGGGRWGHRGHRRLRERRARSWSRCWDSRDCWPRRGSSSCRACASA